MPERAGRLLVRGLAVLLAGCQGLPTPTAFSSAPASAQAEQAQPATTLRPTAPPAPARQPLDEATARKDWVKVAQISLQMAANEISAAYRSGEPRLASATFAHYFRASDAYRTSGRHLESMRALFTCHRELARLGQGEECAQEHLKRGARMELTPQVRKSLEAAVAESRRLREESARQWAAQVERAHAERLDAKRRADAAQKELVETVLAVGLGLIAVHQHSRQQAKRENQERQRELARRQVEQLQAASRSQAATPPPNPSHMPSPAAHAISVAGATSSGLAETSKRVNMPGHRACISVDWGKRDEVWQWYTLRNTCAMPLSVHWCDGRACTVAGSAATLASGGKTTSNVSRRHDYAIRILQACSLKNGSRDVNYSRDNNQCYSYVTMGE